MSNTDMKDCGEDKSYAKIFVAQLKQYLSDLIAEALPKYTLLDAQGKATDKLGNAETIVIEQGGKEYPICLNPLKGVQVGEDNKALAPSSNGIANLYGLLPVFTYLDAEGKALPGIEGASTARIIAGEDVIDVNLNAITRIKTGVDEAGDELFAPTSGALTADLSVLLPFVSYLDSNGDTTETSTGAEVAMLTIGDNTLVIPMTVQKCGIRKSAKLVNPLGVEQVTPNQFVMHWESGDKVYINTGEALPDVNLIEGKAQFTFSSYVPGTSPSGIGEEGFEYTATLVRASRNTACCDPVLDWRFTQSDYDGGGFGATLQDVTRNTPVEIQSATGTHLTEITNGFVMNDGTDGTLNENGLITVLINKTDSVHSLKGSHIAPNAFMGQNRDAVAFTSFLWERDPVLVTCTAGGEPVLAVDADGNEVSLDEITVLETSDPDCCKGISAEQAKLLMASGAATSSKTGANNTTVVRLQDGSEVKVANNPVVMVAGDDNDEISASVLAVTHCDQTKSKTKPVIRQPISVSIAAGPVIDENTPLGVVEGTEVYQTVDTGDCVNGFLLMDYYSLSNRVVDADNVGGRAAFQLEFTDDGGATWKRFAVGGQDSWAAQNLANTYEVLNKTSFTETALVGPGPVTIGRRLILDKNNLSGVELTLFSGMLRGYTIQTINC